MTVPVGELEFAGGGDGAVDGGQQQVLSDGEALVALDREEGINQSDKIEALGDIEQRGDIGESGDLGFERLPGVLGGGDQIVDFAEIDLADDLGLAIDALAVAGIVIGVAADYLGVRLGIFRSYHNLRDKSTWKCSGSQPES